jgi:hypothetical protein
MTLKTPHNIFSDKSSLILRAMLENPSRKWTVPSFVEAGVSAGLASLTINTAEAAGFVEHVRRVKGESYCRIVRREALLKEWSRAYSFEKNSHAYYLYPGKDFLAAADNYFRRRGAGYALTLYSATRLISPYVKDDRHFLYVDAPADGLKEFLKETESRLGLHQVAERGNVCLALPFYKSSVFRDARQIEGYPVASDLQLYLDLNTFAPVGRQELEENLIPLWKGKKVPFVS